MQEAEKRNKVLYHLTCMWNPSSQVTPPFSLPSWGPRQCGAEKLVHTTNLGLLYAATASWQLHACAPCHCCLRGGILPPIPQEGWEIVKEFGSGLFLPYDLLLSSSTLCLLYAGPAVL